MRFWFCWALLGASVLSACAREDSTPDGAVLRDAELELTRAGNVDSAEFEIQVGSDSVLVAFLEEQGTDVRLRLTAPDARTVVENHLGGVGLEVATLAAPRGARVKVAVTGTADAATPGRVHLKLLRFAAGSANYSEQVSAFRSWSQATAAKHRADSMKALGLAAMDRAIRALDSVRGDPVLAAQARLTKAGLLGYYRIDWRASRDEAQRAAAAFAALPAPANANVARAQYLAALALIEISGDGAAAKPTSTEALAQARTQLIELGAASSPLQGLERARAVSARGDIDLETGNTLDAEQRYLEAQAIYRDAGYTLGELRTRFSLAAVLLDRGSFRDAAQAFDALLPQLDRIPNPDVRAAMHIHAARALAFSGRGDESPEHLHQALAIAREHKLRAREAAALHGLGNVFQTRGDPLQAREFYAEAIKITREERDIVNLVGALELAGFIARSDGDIAKAFEYHEEAVRLASNPVALARSLRALALDHYHSGQYEQAIAVFRRAIAVKLQDPSHHAYSDIKRDLAEALIAEGDGKPATLAEADTLVSAALKRSLEVGDVQGIIGGHRVKAMLFAARGQRVQAQAEYEESLTEAHAYRERIASNEARAAPLRHEQAAMRGYLDLMLADIALRGAGAPRRVSNAEEAALRRLETAREGNFGAVRTGELDPATSAQVDHLLAQMADRSFRIASKLQQDPKANDAEELRVLQLEMSNLYSELDRVRTAAALRRARAENFKPNPARAWRELAPGEVQLSYALGNDYAYAWARSAGGIFVSVLGKKPQDLERELAELGALDRQAEPQKVEQALERLSTVLLPKGLLPEQSSSIEVAAEGRIASVSFPALRLPGGQHRRLVETHSITMVTSLFAIEEAPRPPQERPLRLVALASGHGTLRSATSGTVTPKLYAATKEIRTVAELFAARDPAAKVKLLSGADGSANAVHDLWVSGVDVVHFATHALADLRTPLASLLVLPATNARGESTYLTAGQVENWRGDAELVFLSACESAIGPPRFAGGMPGLQRAFLRAGARGVIATLWPIEDVLAEEFSADFYRRYTRGASAVQALGETQRAWLAATPGLDTATHTRRRITALAHAYYAN